MDGVTIIVLTAGLFFWLLSLVAMAIKVLAHTRLSVYEIRRRAESGDAEASQLLKYHMRRPQVRAFIALIQMMTLVLAVSLIMTGYPNVIGLLINLAVAAVVLWLARTGTIRGIAQKFWNRHEAAVYRKVSEWRWLKPFTMSANESVTYGVDSHDELRMIIDNSRHTLDLPTRQRLKASLALGDTVVRDVMTPVSAVDAIAVDESLGPLVLDSLHKTGHSRFPVYESDLHHIVGMLYLHDIVELRSAKSSVREAMDPRAYFIREDKPLTHALHGFLRSRHHLFIVVNDYRETVGVLSLEDVLESSLGHKIVDEFDQFDDLRAVAAANPRHNNELKGSIDI